MTLPLFKMYDYKDLPGCAPSLFSECFDRMEIQYMEKGYGDAKSFREKCRLVEDYLRASTTDNTSILMDIESQLEELGLDLHKQWAWPYNTIRELLSTIRILNSDQEKARKYSSVVEASNNLMREIKG